MFVAIFICFLVNLFVSYHGYDAAAITKKPPTIGEIINKDVNICNATQALQESKYVQECSKLNFIEQIVNITDENIDQALCTALYDRLIQIYKYNNNTNNISLKNKEMEKDPVLNNHTIFDETIEKIVKKGDDPILSLCELMNNLSMPGYNKTLQVVTKLQATLKGSRFCVSLCGKDDKVSPLCAALGVIDQKLNEITKSNTKMKESTSVELQTTVLSNLNSNNKTTKQMPGKDSETKNKTLNNQEVPANVGKEVKHHDENEKGIEDTKQKSIPDGLKPVEDSEKIEKTKVGNGGDDDNDDDGDDDILSDKKKSDKDEEKTRQPTLSDKTRMEDIDQSDYILQTPDNEQIPDDVGFSQDDIQRTLPKDILQSGDNGLDQKENIARFPSGPGDDESHFAGYFTVIGLLFICGLLIYHRKQKILAMIVEGRRSRNGRGRKRPSTATYRKLDCNLEEAVTSQCNSNVTHVIY